MSFMGAKQISPTETTKYLHKSHTKDGIESGTQQNECKVLNRTELSESQKQYFRYTMTSVVNNPGCISGAILVVERCSTLQAFLSPRCSTFPAGSRLHSEPRGSNNKPGGCVVTRDPPRP